MTTHTQHNHLSKYLDMLEKKKRPVSKARLQKEKTKVIIDIEELIYPVSKKIKHF